MKKSGRRFLLSMACGLAVAAAIFFTQSGAVLAQEQKVQVIELTAKKYEYAPAPVRVKAGTKVQLKITATDHDHGFKIEAVPDGAAANGAAGLVFTAAQDCWLLKKGETTTIEFVAQTAGTYTFKCCHSCGLGHRNMKGQIVVE
jgi:heme/copper-type cytochrome/quinol oxidase subunit 2